MISIQLNVMLGLLLFTNKQALQHFRRRFYVWKGVNLEDEQNKDRHNSDRSCPKLTASQHDGDSNRSQAQKIEARGGENSSQLNEAESSSYKYETSKHRITCITVLPAKLDRF